MRRSSLRPSHAETLAASVSGILLILLALLAVWGRPLLPSGVRGDPLAVVSGLLLIAVVGLTTLILAGRRC
jgi:hypothetical protein